MKKRILFVLLTLLSMNLVLKAQVNLTATSGTTSGTYSNLYSAFTKINDGTHRGKIIITLSENISESSAVLYGSGTGSANYDSVRIYPTVSGVTISGNQGTALIDLNGADYVTFDGRVNASGFTTDLTITNTNTSGSTVRFINAATNNNIKYCVIKGSSTSDGTGVLYFSTSSGSTGNNNNIVDHNEITNAGGNRPVNTIASDGSSSYPNSSNTISNNNIHDVLNANSAHAFVIKLGIGGDGGQSYNDAWTISGNSFYDTQDFSITSGNNMRIIYIYADGGNAFNISNNYFGGSVPLCGGMWNKTSGNNTFSLMEFRVGTSTASQIQGNTIKNINFTNTGNGYWWGINMQRGSINIGTIAGNCYGASDGTGSVTFTANGNSTFYAFYFQSSNVNAQNNTIGSITVANSSSTHATNFCGICFNSNGTECSLSNNTIGSISTSNSINATSASTTDAQNVYGIKAIGNSGKLTVNNNTIANLTNGTTNSSTTAYGRIYGILLNKNTTTVSGNLIHHLTIANANAASDCSQGNPDDAGNAYISAAGIAFANSDNTAQTITGNTIYNISNTNSSFTGHVAGIYYNGASTASTVSGNLIYGLSVNSGSTLSTMHGIKIDQGVVTYSNNIVNLGGSTVSYIYGIYDAGSSGTSNIYYNTVYISGSPTPESKNSACLYNAASSSTRNYRNNIFFNARSNVGSLLGKHYAIYLPGTSNLTIDYNDYFFTGTGGYLGYLGSDKSTLADWKTATSQDTHSLNTNPSFANPGGTNARDYIPLAALTAVEGTGILTDYGGTTRAVLPLYPEMGAWEQNNTITWTGATSEDWNVTTNWNTSTVPTASANVSIPALSRQPHVTASIGTPAVCNNLTIQSEAELTIDPGKALTVNGTLTNNHDKDGLVIESDDHGTGSLIQSSSSVAATVKRYITGSATLTANMYHLVSIPVNYASPTSNLFLGSYLYRLDATQADPTNGNYYGKWVYMGESTTTPLSCTSGYMIYYPASSTTYTFTGNLNTGSFSPTVSYGGTYTFNLIPNPYPSAIDWGSSGGWVKSNIGATAWIWKGSTGNYTTVTASPYNYIPAGQAFIVMASGDPTLTVNNSACVHNVQAFYKSTEANKLKIEARSNNYYDETFVGFNNSATPGFDLELDGFKLWGMEEAPQLWTEAESFKMSINELPPPAGSMVVPLDFKTSIAGQVTLNFTGVESFDQSLPIRLRDNITGSMTDLRQQSVYIFTHDTLNSEKRFSLIFGYPTGVTAKLTSDGRGYINNSRIYLDLPSMQNQQAETRVYNSLGQLIHSHSQMINRVISFEAPLAKGIYIVHVSTANCNFVTKVINK